MSKQTDAKARQGYNLKPIMPVCSTCRYYTSRMESGKTSWGAKWNQEKELRCGIGGFAIKKMASCDEWGLKV